MEKQDSTWSSVLTAIVVLASFTGARYVVAEIRQERAITNAVHQIQDGSVFEDLRTGAVTPYAFIVRADSIGGAPFRRAFAESVGLNVRRGLPGAQLRIDEQARTDDLATAWRGIVGYSGRASFEGSPYMDVRGEVRGYYHEEGAVSLEALCIDELGACGETYRGLIDRAEAALLVVMTSTSLDDVLPRSNDCSLEKLDVPQQGRTAVFAVCIYEPGVVLTLNRMDREGTVEVLAAVANDPDFVALIRRHMRE
jgi:hypothetical protein